MWMLFTLKLTTEMNWFTFWHIKFKNNKMIFNSRVELSSSLISSLTMYSCVNSNIIFLIALYLQDKNLKRMI